MAKSTSCGRSWYFVFGIKTYFLEIEKSALKSAMSVKLRFLPQSGIIQDLKMVAQASKSAKYQQTVKTGENLLYEQPSIDINNQIVSRL